MKQELLNYSMGELMNLNWNRISELSKVMNKTDSEKREFGIRIKIQNKFSNGTDDSEVKNLILWIDELKKEVK